MEGYAKESSSADTYRNVSSELRYLLESRLGVVFMEEDEEVKKDISDMIMRVVDACERKAIRFEGG